MCTDSTALPKRGMTFEAWMFDARGLALPLGSAILPLYASIYEASYPGEDGQPSGSWHKSLSAFAAETGFARQTITSAIAELVDRGLVDMLGLTTCPTDKANVRVYRANPQAALEAQKRRALALVGQEEPPELGDEGPVDIAAQAPATADVAQVPPVQRLAAPAPSWDEERPVSPAPRQALPKQDPDFDRWYRMYPREDKNPCYRSSTMRSYELLKREGWSADQIEAATLAAIQDYRSRNDRPESGPDYWKFMRYPVRFLNEDIRDFLPKEKPAQAGGPDPAGNRPAAHLAPEHGRDTEEDGRTSRNPARGDEREDGPDDLISRAPLQMFTERDRTTAIATVQVPWRTDLWGTALYPTRTLVVSATVDEGANKAEARAALTLELRRMLGENVAAEASEGETDE